MLISGNQAVPSRVDKIKILLSSFGSIKRSKAAFFQLWIQKIGERVKHALVEFKPDIVHCHDPYAGWAVAQADPDHHFRMIETVHGPALYEARMGGIGR